MSAADSHDDRSRSTPPEMVDPVRSFRDRLAAPVTVVTSGDADRRTGLTVSSIMVAEGSPSYVHVLVGLRTDLWDRIQDTGSFVVHILSESQQELSDRFAFIRPSPGGLFAGIDAVDTDFGPEIETIGSRIRCRYVGHFETSYHALVHGVIEDVLLDDLQQPLQYFRGEYFHG